MGTAWVTSLGIPGVYFSSEQPELDSWLRDIVGHCSRYVWSALLRAASGDAWLGDTVGNVSRDVWNAFLLRATLGRCPRRFWKDWQQV